MEEYSYHYVVRQRQFKWALYSTILYIYIYINTLTYTLHVIHADRRLKLYMPMSQIYAERQLKLFLESKAKAFPQCQKDGWDWHYFPMQRVNKCVRRGWDLLSLLCESLPSLLVGWLGKRRHTPRVTCSSLDTEATGSSSSSAPSKAAYLWPLSVHLPLWPPSLYLWPLSTSKLPINTIKIISSQQDYHKGNEIGIQLWNHV